MTLKHTVPFIPLKSLTITSIPKPARGSFKDTKSIPGSGLECLTGWFKSSRRISSYLKHILQPSKSWIGIFSASLNLWIRVNCTSSESYPSWLQLKWNKSIPSNSKLYMKRLPIVKSLKTKLLLLNPEFHIPWTSNSTLGPFLTLAWLNSTFSFKI